MNRYAIASLTLLTFTACERRIREDGEEVCPEGYFHALGESCASTQLFGWSLTLLLAAFLIFAMLRMFSFISTVEQELKDIKALLKKD